MKVHRDWENKEEKKRRAGNKRIKLSLAKKKTSGIPPFKARKRPTLNDNFKERARRSTFDIREEAKKYCREQIEDGKVTAVSKGEGVPQRDVSLNTRSHNYKKKKKKKRKKKKKKKNRLRGEKGKSNMEETWVSKGDLVVKSH